MRPTRAVHPHCYLGGPDFASRDRAMTIMVGFEIGVSIRIMTARSPFSFFHPLRVRWAEVDAQRIVYNPNYFLYFDVGMTEYTRAIGFRYPDGLLEQGSDFFAVNANANFRGSALYDDELEIGVRVARIGRTSFVFAMNIFRGNELLVDGSLTYVNGALDTKQPTPLPESFIERVLAFERIAPERKT
jgi:acyl-CoA thioester hydrolase